MDFQSTLENRTRGLLLQSSIRALGIIHKDWLYISALPLRSTSVCYSYISWLDFQPPHHKQNSGVGTKSRSQILQIMDHTWNLDNKLATHLSMKTAIPAHYYWHAQKNNNNKIKILHIERSTFSNSPLSNSHNLKKKVISELYSRSQKAMYL